MALADLNDWMDEQTRPEVLWYAKRLSGNDTLANGSHQAGPYIPKDFLFDVFPSLNKPAEENPDKRFELRIDSHPDVREVRAVWYNNKLRGGTRNESRITNFGGGSSVLLDPESTGALTVFAFQREQENVPSTCNVWVCGHETEEDLVEDRIGPVEPGTWRIWSAEAGELHLFGGQSRTSCWLEANEIPAMWLQSFPSTAELIRKTVEMRPDGGLPIDQRLLRRRDCEFSMFRSVEEAVELPWIRQGFRTVDEYIARAQTILQRRKSRSGRSLELHTRELFLEEEMLEGKDFSHQPESEAGKRPDFLFPSEAAYKDRRFSAHKLRMLAVKTTCKDRWRQILTEADRIPQKHLLTLQEGVSEGQFREMTDAGVQLVVPKPLKDAYPASVQPYLCTLEEFVGDVRLLVLS